MRILLLTHYYFPSIQSCAKLMHDLATEFRDQGHEVILAVPDASLRVRNQVTEEAGITVLRVRSGSFRGVPRPLRALNEWRLSGAMWRGARGFFREHPCELIVNYSPTIFFGPLVKRLKRLWSSKNYLILRDIFPQWGVDAGLIREGGLVHRLFRHYELLLYSNADVVGVESEPNLEYFRKNRLAERYSLEVLHNWAPTAGQKVAAATVRKDLGIEDRVIFLYGGNLGVAQDADCVVRLAAAMHDEPSAFFLVVGDGSEAERLEREAAERGLDNLVFLPPVDQTRYLGLVSEADVGLLTLSRHLTTHNTPGKMLDYMYFGKPMLAAVNIGNNLRGMVERQEAGFVCWNGDDQALQQACLSLLRNPELREQLGRNSRALLETLFSSTPAARQILAHF